MPNRVTAIRTAIAAITTKFGERASLRKQLAEKAAELESANSLISSLRALSDITLWAELDSGKAIKSGDVVRYFGKNYVCAKDHTKAILRSPSNAEYWTEQTS